MIKKLFEKIVKNKFYLLLIVGVITLISVTFGSAYLSSTLSIIGNTKISKNSWIIYFDDVQISSDSVSAEVPADIIDRAKTQIEFKANLEKPGDIYEFTVYTVNDGTIDAMVESVEKSILTDAQKEYLDFDVTYDNGDPIQRCDELNAGTRRLIKAYVKFKKDVDMNKYPTSDVNLSLYFNIHYIQKSDLCPPNPEHKKNKLTIRPNGGTYDDRTAEKRIYLDKDEEYTLLPVTRRLYNFDEWRVLLPTEGGTYTFEDGVFKMGDEDVTIEAVWIEGNYVARIMDTYYPTIQQAFDDALNSKFTDNTVWLLKDTTEYPTNNTSDAFVFNLDGHTVHGTITNSTNGKITLVNGTIEAEPEDTEAFINNGSLTLGTDDDNVEVENSIALIGNDIGLNNKKGSKFYFYDGYIEGTAGLVGGYTDKAEGYYVFVNHNGTKNCQRVYLVKNPNRAVAKTLTQGTIFYYNLQDAFNSSVFNKKNDNELGDDDYVVYAIRDFEAAYPITVNDGERVFYELDGYEVEYGEPITNNGYFVITNSKDRIIQMKPSMTITNTGDLKIDNVKVNMTTDFTAIANTGSLDLSNSEIHAVHDVAVTNTGDATIKFNQYTVIDSQQNYGLYNSSSNLVIDAGIIRGFRNVDTSGNVEITGSAQLKNQTYSYYVYAGVTNEGVMKQTGGFVTTDGGNAPLVNSGTYTITDGVIYGPTVSIRQNINNIRGTINVEGGDVSGLNVTIEYGTVNVKNGAQVVSENGPAIQYATLNLYDGEVSSEHGTTIYDSSINIYGGELIGAEYVGTKIGTFYIEGGKVTGTDKGIYTSNAVITGGEVEVDKTAITTDNLNISDGIVTSLTGTGIVVNSNGLLTGGTIQGDIYGVQSKNTITLGQDDGTISSDAPVLIGGSYGLYIEGPTTDFYDGILKGQIDGYNEETGRITGTPLGSFVAEGNDTINEILYETDFVANYKNWLQVGDEVFNSTNDASNACPENDTCLITVIDDPVMTFTQKFLDTNKNKNITFDLNGHTIKSTQSIINETTLTIVDSSAEQTGTIEPTRVPLLNNFYKMTIEAGNYQTTQSNSSIKNTRGEMTINGGKFRGYKYAIENDDKLTINDADIYGDIAGIYVSSYGTNYADVNYGHTIVEGGTIKGGSYAFDHATGATTVNGGLVEGPTYAFNGSGDITVNDGYVHSINDKTIRVRGNVEINGGRVVADNDVAVSTDKNTIINGGYIEGTTAVEHREFCIVTCTWYPTIITGGEINGTVNHGVVAHGNALTITGGTIYGKIDGVQNLGAVGRIGTNDGNISTSVPNIRGERYGLNVTSYTQFFDGILKGQNKAHIGLIGLVPDGTTIKDDYEFINRKEYKTQYLTEYTDWLQVGDETFDSLTDALEAVSVGGTIKVIADASINFEQVIPHDKDIIFDLNGHTVTMTQSLVNRGTMNIIDSAGNGYIHNIRVDAIVNHGSMTIDGGNFVLSADQTIINGNYAKDFDYAIDNDGTLVFNDGTIDTIGGIDNSGHLTINGGFIRGTSSYSILSTGTLIINNGEISKTNDSTLHSYAGGTTINGGKITNETDTAISMSDIGGACSSLTVNGGEINGATRGIYATTRCSVTINGGHITASNGTGIYTKAGSMHIVGGVIEGSTYGVHVNGYTTLGNDDGTIDIDLPILKGDLYGLYIESGTLNFYDGILKGITGANYGQITNIPDRAQIFVDSEVINDNTYETKYLITETDIVKNLNTGVVYTNFQDSLDEAAEGQVLQLINNVPLYYEVKNLNQASFSLDLNGYTISTNKPIRNEGKLRIFNDNDEKDGIIKTSSSLVLLTNTNTLDLENIVVRNTSSDRYVLYNTNKMTLTDTTIEAINGVDNRSNLTITNAFINTSGICVNNSATLSITGGTYTTGERSYAIYSNTNGTAIVTNANINGTLYNNRGTFNSTGNNINLGPYHQVSNNGVIYMTEDTITGRGAISNSNRMEIKDSHIRFDGGNYIGNHSVNIDNSSILIIDSTDIRLWENGYTGGNVTGINNNGTVTLKNNSLLKIGGIASQDGTRIGINDYSNGQANIEDSTINVFGGETSYGVIAQDTNSHVTILTGEVKVQDAKVGYGAYANYGRVTMGHEDGVEQSAGNVSQSNPIVYGHGTNKGFGVKKRNGEFEFYDGIIWGSRFAKPETTSLVEKLYEVTTYVDNDTGFEFAWLEFMGDDYSGDTVVFLNGNYYPTIQEAIDNYTIRANPGDELKLLKSVSQDFTVPEGISIPFNLNGHSVTGQVINNGELHVFEGSLQNFGNTPSPDIPEEDEPTPDEPGEGEPTEDEEVIEPSVTVINNGHLIIGENDRKVSSTNIRIVNEDIGIVNNGTISMYDGYIEGNPSIQGEINEIAEYSRVITIKEAQYERTYLQSLDEESIKNRTTALFLTIDPNGGYYNNSTRVKNEYVYYHDEYELLTPTTEDWNAIEFDHWEITGAESFENGVITVGVQDITAKAIWNIKPTAIAKIGDTYYFSLIDALDHAKENDKIELLNDTTEDITNKKNLTIDLGGHKITGAFINEGILTVLNGEIYNPDGIGLHNLKTLTMGVLDRDYEKNSIKITGDTVGLQQDGRFNFYDGYISGDVAMNGIVNSAPKGLTLCNDMNDSGKQGIFLSGTPENIIASISDGGVPLYFFNLSHAIATAKVTGGEIKIEADFTARYEVNVPEGADVTINMNSHDINLSEGFGIQGKLTLYDLSENAGSITSASTITNNGELVIQGIKIHQNKSQNTINNNGKLIVRENVLPDSNVVVPAIIEGTDKYAISNNGQLELTGDYRLIATNYALEQNGTMNELSSGTIHGITWRKDTIINAGTTLTYTLSGKSGNLTVDGAPITIENDVCIYTYQGSNLSINISNSQLTCKKGIYLQESSNNKVYAQNNTFNVTEQGIYTYSGSGHKITTTDNTMEVTNGQGFRINTSSTTITSTGDDVLAKSYAIMNESSSNTYNFEGNYVSTNDVGFYDNTYKSGSTLSTIRLNGGKVEGANYAMYGRYMSVAITNTELKTNSTSRDQYALYTDGWVSIYLNEGAFLNAPNASGFRESADLYMEEGSRIYSGNPSGYGIAAVWLNGYMKGGTIETPGTGAIGIYTYNDLCQFTMYDGKIESGHIGVQLNDTNGSYGKYYNMYKGTIIGDTYGIYISTSHSVMVGNKEDDDSQNNPFISGGVYGIYRSAGSIDFYNGRLRGYLGGYSGNMNLVKSGKAITTTYDSTGIDLSLYTVSTTNISDSPVSQYAKRGHGYALLTYIDESDGICNTGDQYPFSYTGNEQTFTASCSGKYKLEVWGASGGRDAGSYGGLGGYATGEIELSDGEKFYINVGGKGADCASGSGGGYNGGGHAGGGGCSGSGGGATSIATQSGLLSTLENNKDSIIIVAGGGAGQGGGSNYNGSGGGYKGATSSGSGGSQTAAGGGTNSGSFGKGGNRSGDGGGGGGGYYGGGAATGDATGGGGSGYTSNPRLSNTVMYGYNVPAHYAEWVNNFLINKDDFLQVGDETFNDFDLAVKAIPENGSGTIILLKDEIVQQDVIFTAGKTITFDLNNHTLDLSRKMYSKGDLTITDNSTQKKGTINSIITTTIENDGNLTIDGISLNQKTSNDLIYAHVGSGTVTVKDATLTSKGRSYYSDVAQKLVVDNSTIETTTESIYLYCNGGTVTITDSVINSNSMGVRIQDHHDNTIKITNTEINSNDRSIYVYGRRNVFKLNNNTFDNKGYAVIESPNYDGNGNHNRITLDGGTYKGTNYTLWLHSMQGTLSNARFETTSTNRDIYLLHMEYWSGFTFDNCDLIATNASIIYENDTLNIKNSRLSTNNASGYGIVHYAGTLTLKNTELTTSGLSSYGIYENYNNGNYNINLEDVTIEAGNIGLYLVNGTRTVNIKSGTINAKNIAINQTVSGITVNIGDQEDELSHENPTISSDNIVISRTGGKTNFYNGRIVSKNKIIVGDFNLLRPEKDIVYDYDKEEGNIETLTLNTTLTSAEAEAQVAKKGNGYAKITYLEASEDTSTSNVENVNVINTENSTTFDIVSDYSYTGDYQVFTAPSDGKYQVELWGAEGGGVSSLKGGRGAYTKGTVTLTKGDKLYVYVGEHINGYKNELSFNGGGKGGYSEVKELNGNGGGATDVRLVNGQWNDFESLKSRIMVAAGGGGAMNWNGGANGGYGGALVGGNGSLRNSGMEPAQGGTQTDGGFGPKGEEGILKGKFGIGGYNTVYYQTYFYNSGGGGGYYGGGAGGAGDNIVSSAAGGSSYISGYEGCVGISALSIKENVIPTATSVHYSNISFEDAVMKAGNEEMPTYDGLATITGNAGSGHAKITYLNEGTDVYVKLISNYPNTHPEYVKFIEGDTLSNLPTPVSDDGTVFEGWYLDRSYTKKVSASTIINSNATLYAKFTRGASSCSSELNKSYTFDYTGTESEFVVSCPGKYSLETWGAQGANVNSYVGGYGGYSYGEIELQKDEVLYINVGGQGITAPSTQMAVGGYNGGGNSYAWTESQSIAGSGGGATHIATQSGLLSTLENNRDKILIVSGGGGGSSYTNGSNYGHGGSGGGWVGGTSVSSAPDSSRNGYGSGGTQTEGGRAYRNGVLTDYQIGSFGQGYSATSTGTSAGGGGGYYGGGSGSHNGAGGGSGYTSNPRLSNAIMFGYDVKTSGYDLVTAYLDDKDGFLEVNGVIYNSFDRAINAIETTGTIKVLSDATIKQITTFPADKTITIDLNGKTLDMTSYFVNNGTVTVTDTSSKPGGIKGKTNYVFRNAGKLVIDKGNYYAVDAVFYGVDGPGSITINSGVTIKGNHAVYADTRHDIVMDGVDIEVSNYAAYLNASSSTLKISNSNIKSNYMAVRIQNTYTRTDIIDSNITSSSHSIYIDYKNNSEMNITGSTITSTGAYALHNAQYGASNTAYWGRATITDSTLVGASYGIYHYGAYLVVDHSEIKTTSSDNGHYAIYGDIYGHMIIKNGSFINAPKARGIRIDHGLSIEDSRIYAGNTSATAIFNRYVDLTLKNSIIETPGSSASGIYSANDSDFNATIINSKIISGNIGINCYGSNRTRYIKIYSGEIYGTNYGLYQTGANHIVTIGNVEEDNNISNPSIEGGLYGVYKTTGTLTMVSGVLKGGTRPYEGTINNLREGYELYESIDDVNGEIASLRTFAVQTSSSVPKAKTAKEDNGYAKITFKNYSTTNDKTIVDSIENDAASSNKMEFTETDKEVEYTIPKTGLYKIEAWGAQGGTSLNNGRAETAGGYGGYSTGFVQLEAGQKIYINVGGKGQTGIRSGCAAGGYNGGGKGTNDSGGCGSTSDDEAGGGGGGATHVALSSGLLSTFEDKQNDLIIVAGGGGGASWTFTPGSGGGTSGGKATYASSVGGTQTEGYAFGQGEDAQGAANSDGVGGGGGGYYGGHAYNVGNASSGTGGSGYIGNSLLSKKYMYCYNCTTSTNSNDYTKSDGTNSCHNSTAKSDCAKEGNGAVRLTMVADLVEYDFINNTEQTYRVSTSGTYKIEAWGAQGGYSGGYGAYAVGYMDLLKDEVLYINVGGQGTSSRINGYFPGGYNGGGDVLQSDGQTGSGGGATSIAKVSGQLPSLESHKGRLSEDETYYVSEDIVLVAAGGGGSVSFSGMAYGGSGGGYKSSDTGGGSSRVSGSVYVYGATQIGPSGTDYYSWGGRENSVGSFGKGGTGAGAYLGGGAGGGGFYGGGGGFDIAPGAGGSSYIANPYLYDKYMVCYDCEENFASPVRTYRTSTLSTSYSSTPITDYAKAGNGYAIITPLINVYSIKLSTTIGTIQNENLAYTPGELLGEIPAPVNDNANYIFDGWYLDQAFTQKVNKKTKVNGDATLYANFIEVNTNCLSKVNTSYEFDYTGTVQEFTAECPGTYTLETWGAQGGSAKYNAKSYRGGYGGYSVGDIDLEANEKLYIYVGGKGQSVDYQQSSAQYITDDGTGFNGGGYGDMYVNNSAHGGGGGATHIATRIGILESLVNNKEDVIMVAAGGGGASAHVSAPSYSGNGGSGGGYVGQNAQYDNGDCYNYGTAGSQTGAGSWSRCPTRGNDNRAGNQPRSPGFGYGSNSGKFSTISTYAGGGSGWYGGGSGQHAPGGGGSSYTAHSRLYNQAMYGYEVTPKNDIIYLNTAYLILYTDKVINKTTNIKYTDIQEALNAATSGDVLEFLSDVSLTSNVTIPDKTITFDLHGYDIITTKQITNNGTLTIEDLSTVGGSSISSNMSNVMIINNKSLTIEGVELSAYTPIENALAGILTINDVIITCRDIGINNKGKLTMDEVTISGGSYGIYSTSAGESTINNIDINSSTSIYSSAGTMTVTNAGIITGTVNIAGASTKANIYGKTGAVITGSVSNAGTTTIKDIKIGYSSSANSNINMISNSGVLTLDNIVASMNINTSNSYDYIDNVVYNSGTLTSVNNSFKYTKASTNRYRRVRGIDNRGILKSTNDTFDLEYANDTCSILTVSSSTAEIRGATINSRNQNTGSGVYVQGDAFISGGLYNLSGGQVSGIYLNSGTATVENVNATSIGTTSATGIYVNTGTLTFTSGTVNADGPTSYGMYIDSGAINMTGGLAKATGTNAYGAFLVNTSAALTLGVNDESVSISTPVIQAIGTTTGYATSSGEGGIYYYDGKMIYSTDYLVPNDMIKRIPTHEDYDIKDYTDVDPITGETYHYCIIEIVY